jgi:hypothetical protein
LPALHGRDRYRVNAITAEVAEIELKSEGR